MGRREREELNAEVERLKKYNVEMNEQLSRANVEMGALRADLNQLHSEHKAVQCSYDLLWEEKIALVNKVERLKTNECHNSADRAQCEELNKQLGEANVEMAAAYAMRDESNAEINRLQHQLADSRGERRNLATSNQELTAELKEAKERIVFLNRRLDLYGNGTFYNELTAEIEGLKDEVKRREDELAGWKNRADDLKWHLGREVKLRENAVAGWDSSKLVNEKLNTECTELSSRLESSQIVNSNLAKDNLGIAAENMMLIKERDQESNRQSLKEASDGADNSGTGELMSKTIDELTTEILAINEEKGWNEGDFSDTKTIASALLMIHAEVSEAAEALRDGDIDYFYHDYAKSYAPPDAKPEGMIVELADVVIRVIHLAGMMNRDRSPTSLSEAITAKLAYNRTRPYRHGGKAI